MIAAQSSLRELGVEITRTYHQLTFVAATIDPAITESILALPFGDYVEPDAQLSLLGSVQRGGGVPPSSQDTSWGVKKIRVHDVWQGTFGTPSRGQLASITIIDSGLDEVHVTSPLGDGPAGIWLDCLYVQGAATSCYDDTYPASSSGHASHVAGIIAARDNTFGYIGIANEPNRFASINVCSFADGCSESAVALALDWATNETLQGYRLRHIVNISMGDCLPMAPIQEAITRASNAGILIVVGAGNTSLGCRNQTVYPAAYPQVVAVGGTLENDAFAAPGASPACSAAGQGAGSVTGSHIDIVAPFWAMSMWGQGQYAISCGTSMAAPVVSGVAALLWTRYPSWTASQIRGRLESTAAFVGSAPYFGHGRIDPLNALYGYTILSGSITGPQVVTIPGMVAWGSYVTGGTTSYAYAWSYATSVDGPFVSIGNSPSVSLSVDQTTPYQFWLRLEVTAGAESSADQIQVVNETNNPCAPFVCLRSP